MSTKHPTNPLLNSMRTLTNILAKYQTLPPEQCYSLLEAATDAVEKHKVERNITDWPFENFWENPDEPCHSRLLAFFIDPAAKHQWGEYLLGKLFENIGQGLEKLPKDKWVVACETAHIDILLTRESDDGKYAIIIENKVNGAIDQHRQLETYFNEALRLGFKDKEIYIFYLPLTKNKRPSDDSLGSLQRSRVPVITFADHILPWLNAVLIADDKRDPELPKGMRTNLEHYRDLIIYLLNKQKEQQMNAEILEHLEKSAKKGKPLPTWSQVSKLTASAEALQECVECVIGGKLLLSIQNQLKLKDPKISAKFYADDGKVVDPQPESPFNQLFAEGVILGITITDGLIVFISITYDKGEKDGKEIVYIGYMPSGNGGKNKHIKSVVKKSLRGSEWVDKHAMWYEWRWDKTSNYENALDADTINRLADQLITMCDDMRTSLGINP